MHNVDCTIIGVFRNSDLTGGCSFFSKTLYPGYTIGYTIDELTPYGGVVITNPTGVQVRESETREQEIISLIQKKIQSLNLAKINLTNGPGLADIRAFTRQGWRERVYYTYVLSLRNDIFLHASHGARKSYRKAQKLGVSIKKEYNPDIFWNLAKSTYEKQKKDVPYTKDQIITFMEMLNRNNLGDMWIARISSGEPASAVVITYDPHMAHGWLGVNDPRFRSTGVVTFLLFETFKDLQNRGFQRFNLMAANTPHLAKFYSSLNPQLIPYYGVEKHSGLGKLASIFG
jgi:lipid II:glycine glycyltransferase (peptidoglycan interpeptide bridge formation enzyme)